jgi:hypothetical protein
VTGLCVGRTSISAAFKNRASNAAALSSNVWLVNGKESALISSMQPNVLAFRVHTHFPFVILSYKCRREEIYLETERVPDSELYLEKETSGVRAEPASNSELSLFSTGLKEKYRYPPILIYDFFLLFCSFVII